MSRHRLVLAAGSFVVMASGAAAADLPLLAQDPDLAAASPSFWTNIYAHVGLSVLVPEASGKVSTPAGVVPGASIRVPPVAAASTEVGYRFTPNWAISVSLGVPPTSDIYGAGTITSAGQLGTNTAGPIAVTAHYHLTTLGRFQPYIGGGPTYSIAFNSHDGSIRDLQVRSAWGAVGQVGADYMLTNKIGFFVDYKKAYLRTTATGFFGLVPITTKAKLDPDVFSGGMTYRF